MDTNLSRISFAAQQINKKTTSGLSKHDFVPLADVPDLVWKIGPYNRGQPEHPNHFADMDKKNSVTRRFSNSVKRRPTRSLSRCGRNTTRMSATRVAASCLSASGRF